MIVECANCCAPLDVNGTSTFVKCSYCGLSNKVRSMKTLSAVTPADWRPPPQWQPPPGVSQRALHYTAAAGAASAGVSGCALVGVAIALVAVLGGAAAAFMAVGARSGGSSVLAPSWDGTAPLHCGGNESMRIENVVAELPNQTAITADMNCSIELVNCSITAWEGISARGNQRVVLRNTVIVAEGNGISARGNRQIELSSSTISAGGIGIDAQGNVDILLAGGRVAGTPQAVRTTRNVDLEVRGTALVDGSR